MSELARIAQEARRQYEAGETEEGGFASDEPELLPMKEGWSAKSKEGWSVRATTREEAIKKFHRVKKSREKTTASQVVCARVQKNNH